MTRIIFMGTPDFAVPALRRLIEAGYTIPMVYTQPPRPGGRGKALRPTPVAQAAAQLGLAVATPPSLRAHEVQEEFAALNADWAVVAAYGLILPPPILAAPRHGCLNIHASLLPRWRGAAPIQRALLAGDRETGVTIMQMDAGLDTGPMRLATAFPLDALDAGAVTAALAQTGAEALCTVLANPEAFPPHAQPDQGVTYAPKIDKAEARLDFTRPATAVLNQIRAFAPAPGAFFEVESGGQALERIRILAGEVIMAYPEMAEAPDRLGINAGGTAKNAAGTIIDTRMTIRCGEGALRPTLVQRAGKAAMAPDALLRGFALPPGTRVRNPADFGDQPGAPL